MLNIIIQKQLILRF